MPSADRSDKIVAEERLRADLGGRLAKYADLKIDQPLSQRTWILLRLGRKPDPGSRRGPGNPGHEGSGIAFDDPFVGADGEGSFERGHVQIVGERAEHRPHVARERMDLIAQLGGAGRSPCHPCGYSMLSAVWPLRPRPVE